MRLLRRHVATFLVVIIVIAGSFVIWKNSDYKARSFLLELEQGNLVSTDGVSLVLCGPPSAKHYLPKAREAQVDLYQAYVSNLRKATLRLQLAYLLLLDNSDNYLEYADLHLREMPVEEIRLWVGLLDDEVFPKQYLDNLYKLLHKSQAECAVVTVGKRYLKNKQYQEAVDCLMTLTDRETAWGASARSAIDGLPVSKCELLLPYLNLSSISWKGVFVAGVLARSPEQRKVAVKYLMHALDSKDRDVVEAAVRELVYSSGEDLLIEEFESYWDSPSEHVWDTLVRKLRDRMASGPIRDGYPFRSKNSD